MKREVGESCFSSEGQDLSYCYFLVENINVTFDDYPGCTFIMSLAYHKCTGLIPIDKWYYIENIDLISHDCPDFDADVLLAQQNGTLAEFSLRVDIMLFEAAKDYLGSNILQYATYIYNFVTAACNQYCWYTATKKGYTYYSYYRGACGEGCCAIESVYYYEYGNIVSETTDVTSSFSNESCDETNACNAIGIVFSSDCIFTCDAYL